MRPLPLNAARLSDLPAGIARPAYDRAALRTGVVHLGPGAFFRAHQAPVFDALAADGERRFGVLAAALVSPHRAAALQAQDGLYVLEVREGEARRRRAVGAVRGALAAAAAQDQLLAALAAPTTHLVTLTITEAGYGAGPGTGGSAAAALLAEALALRRDRGLAPFTALSCDNLDDNGARLRSLVLAAARDRPDLADWIAWRGAFPSSMVDRIAPAADAEDRACLAAETGVSDAALTLTEPFWRWVIEDRFAGARPDLERAGVTLTRDVRPFARAKLRLLNAAHSALAYLGLLQGDTFVHEAIARPGLAALVERLWDEAAATLAPPPELDLARYRADLMRRFANAALAHRLDQVASDGSQKLPPRLIAPLAEREGRPSPALALAVAAWLKAAGAADRRFTDAKDEHLKAWARDGGEAPERLARAERDGLLPVLPPLGRRHVAEALARLDSAGPEAALAAAIAEG